MSGRCAIIAFVVSAALAGATREVRGHGAETHAAPRTAPSDSAVVGEIGRRIAAAEPGATIEVPAGVYREHLRIDRSVTLIGVGRPVIDGMGSGDIVEITAPDVTVRGFVIRHTGSDLDKENAAVRALAPRARIEENELEDCLFGIDLRSAPGSVVRGNRIGGQALDIARRGDGLRLWRSDESIVEQNVIHDGRDAILWYSRGVIARRNRVLDSRYGLHLMFSDEVQITENVCDGNSVGIYLMYSRGVELCRNRLLNNRGPSGYGIGLKETDRFTVEGNLIAGNRAGIYIDGSPFTQAQPGVFRRNALAYNDVGVLILPSARGNEFTENDFVDNLDQVAVAGRGDLLANRFWVGETGNYWSDYTGYDNDADGIGDFVHESQTLFDSMLDREPKLRLFLFSPAQQAIEFVGRALPAVRPAAKFTDEVPRMKPFSAAATLGEGERSAEARIGATTSVLLLLAGAAVMAIGAGGRA